MTYGLVGSSTRAWIERRAAQSGLTMTQVDIESESETAQNLSIIFDGALDEEFLVGAEYADTVAEWVIELLRDTNPRGEWEVSIHRDNPDDPERLFYCSNFQE